MLSATARRRIKKFVFWTEVFILLMVAAGVGVTAGAIYQINKLLPDASAIDHYRAPVGTKIYSSDNVLLANVAIENREPVVLDKIPQHMRDAIVAIEDARFYRHNGIDFRGLARAVFTNVVGGELSQGASTITQQLARNMFLSSRKTLSRKAKEALLAMEIERTWTKKQILQAYLNQVYFGSGAYGVQAAARTYFNKNISEVTLEEAAVLAALVQRPSRLSPYSSLAEDGSFDRTKSRRDMVLMRMRDLGFIDARRLAQGTKAPIKVASNRRKAVGYFKAKYFVQHAVDELRERFGYDEELLAKSGLRIITSLNWKMQREADRIAHEELAKLRGQRISEVALLCLDPHTGYIRAMVGGANDPWEAYQFNCATQARRQPGSTFKLFVYATAFEQGQSAFSSVSAAIRPTKLPNGKWYKPRNHGRFGGPVSFVTAFASSVNTAAVNLSNQVGRKHVMETARRFGLKGRLNYYPAMALGTCEASPLEMANAYGIFPANGKRAEPMAVVKIVEQDGSIREDIHPRLRDMGLHDGTVASMDTLTRAVVTSGTGRAASIVPDAHGKTGTTEDSTDAWFVGYTPDLVTAVWAGNRNNKPMAQSVYGGHVCAPIWAKFMLRAIELNPSRKPEAPTQLARKTEPETEAEKAARAERRARRRRERLKAQEDAARMAPDEDGTDRGTVRISVCAESGELAGPGCPRRTQVYSLGEAPTTRCGIAHGDRAVRDSTKEDRGKEKPPAEKPPIDEKKDDGDAKKDTANN